jgi:signal transduction histidine kinase
MSELLKMCSDKRYPPYLFYDSQKKLKGFNVDLIEELATELGIATSFEPMSWGDALEAVRNQYFDVLVGVAVSSKRQEIFDFTQDYLVVSHCIFVSSASNLNISSLNDLKGLKVALQRTDVINSDTIKSDGNFELTFNDFDCILVDELDEAISQLLNGNVDAFVGNQLSGLHVAQQMGSSNLIKIAGEPIYTKQYAFAVAKGRGDLISLLNKGITRLKLTGKYDQICAKWFGKVAVDNQVLENVGAGMIGLNKVGIINFYNSLVQKLIFSDLNFTQKHYMETPLKNSINTALLQEALTLGKAFFDKEIMFTIDGDEKILSYNICPLFQPSGEINGAIITIRDVTEEMKLKQMLIEKDKMESLGYLLANIAHEIRNPLASIKTFTELLPEMYDDPAYRKEIVSCIPQEITRLDKLIKELLEYARPQRANKIVCNVKNIVDSLLPFFKYNQTFKHISYNIQINNTIAVWADEHQLKQIFINLLRNASDAFFEQGSITISAKSEDKKITISIQDNGSGIPNYLLDKIYEPFFTTKEKGTGLGLFIVYQLVRENQGYLEIKSIENVGTQVLLTFPAKEAVYVT